MNKVQAAKIKHHQLQIIEFFRNNAMSLEQLKWAVELMQHQEMMEKNNLIINQPPIVSSM